MFGAKLHRYIFLLSASTTLFGIALSPFLTSLGVVLFLINWLFELDFANKWKRVSARKSILWFLAIFIIHLVWLFNTSNFPYAFHDIKVKLPLFLLPIVIGSSAPLNRTERKIILYSFIVATLVGTLISAVIYFGFTELPGNNKRDASIFISHIRFALFTVLCIYTLLDFLLESWKLKGTIKWVYLLFLFWFLTYIFLIGAFTGVVLFIVLSPFYSWAIIKRKRSPFLRWTAIGSVVTILAISAFTVGNSYLKFKKREPVNVSELKDYTINGNPYIHAPDHNYENEFVVWVNVCQIELKNEWQKRSQLDIQGKDLKGNALRHTLIRYMASLGLTKDSVGISMLKDEDIRMIEQGFSNHIFKRKYSVYPRLYQTFWELEGYFYHGNPNGYSMALRWEYLMNSLKVFRSNLLLGTGTGDINDDILSQYETDQSIIVPLWRFRTHNQYVTLLATFGILGFGILCFCTYRSLQLEYGNFDRLTICFLIMIAISMLSEDTLETQAGATIVAFFVSFFIWGKKPL